MVMTRPQRACRMAGRALSARRRAAVKLRPIALSQASRPRRLQIVGAAAAGIVDQHLDRAFGLRDRRSRGIDAGPLRQVAGHDAVHGPAAREDHVARCRERTLVTSHDRQHRAFRGERKRRAAPMPALAPVTKQCRPASPRSMTLSCVRGGGEPASAEDEQTSPALVLVQVSQIMGTRPSLPACSADRWRRSRRRRPANSRRSGSRHPRSPET